MENVQTIAVTEKEVREYSMRFNARSLNAALSAATKRSLISKCLVWVFPTYTGYKVTARKPSLPYAHPYRTVVYADGNVTIADCKAAA